MRVATSAHLVEGAKWRVRVPATRVEADRAAFERWCRLPPSVRWKGPKLFTSEWREWMALGEYVHDALLKTFDADRWAWFTTLTHGNGVGVREAHIQSWGNALARFVEKHMVVLFGIENSDDDGEHAHALTAFPRMTTPPTIRQARAQWRGYSDVRTFDSDLGGDFYVVKDGRWGVAVGCPGANCCRHSGGCRWKHRAVPVSTDRR